MAPTAKDVTIATAGVEAIIKREGEEASCAYLWVSDLAKQLDMSRADVLRAAADAVDAGVFTATALEISR